MVILIPILWMIPVFFSTIRCIDSLSSQEDLAIRTYHHLACLKLKPETEFLLDYQQDDTYQPYQSFSSSQMNVELCFRLCRRWIIFMNENETQCLCFYALTKPYEFEIHLGEIVSPQQCSSNTLKIFSLTKDFYLFPTPSATHDWTLDGCYYLHGIQTVRADLQLVQQNYTVAMENCRKHCQLVQNTHFFSFFLSARKLCYCLPVEIAPAIVPLGVRKPLSHCSFLPIIQSTLPSRWNESEIHWNTVVKIDVQRYCSPTFVFDRYLYLCLKFAQLNRVNTYSRVSQDEPCSPILIKTEKDWTYFTSFSFALQTRTFIWIDPDSTYLLQEVFENKTNLASWNHVCLVASRNSYNNATLFDLVSCSRAAYAGFTLCSQKPLKTILNEHAYLQLKHEPAATRINTSLACPSGFLLFNGVCYFVHHSFVTTLRAAREVCAQQHRDSTLVEFSRHEWSNVNGTRFAGRNLEDLLLEVFYYELETRTSNATRNSTQQRHWLRVLLGDEHEPHQCILRYFSRSSGSFTTLHKCEYGGHPVCQTHPTLKPNLPIPSTTNAQATTTKTTTTTHSTTADIELTTVESHSASFNLTNSSTIVDSSNTSLVENYTTIFVPDEDLLPVEMNMTSNASLNSSLPGRTVAVHADTSTRYRPLLLIIAGPLLALMLLLVGMICLTQFIRRIRGSYSPDQIMRDPNYRRKRHSTPTLSSTRNSNTPTVLYSRLKSHSVSYNSDTNLIHPSDHTVTNDDSIQLLRRSGISNSIQEEPIKEDDEEPFYTMMKDSQEK